MAQFLDYFTFAVNLRHFGSTIFELNPFVVWLTEQIGLYGLFFLKSLVVAAVTLVWVTEPRYGKVVALLAILFGLIGAISNIVVLH